MSGSWPADFSGLVRRRLRLRGQVQGVGFRPYVHNLAVRHRLAGLVANDEEGAVIEIEGGPADVAAFEAALLTDLPPLARISEIERSDIPASGTGGFLIAASRDTGTRRPDVTPDAAVCDACLAELCDPIDRRYRYPFINCTHCGPRYSIIRTVPYDRPGTTMAAFAMCGRCAQEYGEPADRRFHAQPIACPACGPHLRLVATRRGEGGAELVADEALRRAADLLGAGAIVAIKGIGGFHLACRADRENTVRKLRERKLRDGKPLALMVPDLASAERLCQLTAADLAALLSPAAPIVLARRRTGSEIAESVAPGCRDLGLMLPYTPLHRLLFAGGLGALVMTSGNLAGLPLTYGDDDALATLGDVADALLLHDREIFRPIDDSVVFTFRDDVIPLRRARGYAPAPLRLGPRIREALHGPAASVLAVGGDLKSAVCLLREDTAILSEHLGDLSYAATYRHFVSAVDRITELFAFTPEVVAHDLHPRYLSTGYARGLKRPTVSVQHHHAHIVSVMAEWDEPGPAIGVACDGVGFGTDGATWGCEILRCTLTDFERLGHLEYFPLVGGDAAAVETWRPAAALLRQIHGDQWRAAFRALPARYQHADAPSPEVLEAFDRQAEHGLNAPPTSSLGRVFDAASFLLGLCARNRHEAEAAMALENAAGDTPADPYPWFVEETGNRMSLSVLPTLDHLVSDFLAEAEVGHVATRFHAALAGMLANAAQRAAGRTGVRVVALSGGCFANRLLLKRLVEILENAGLRVLYHREVPSGDGGLALGQALVAAARHADHPQRNEEAG